MTNLFRAKPDWPYSVSSGGVVYRQNGQATYYLLLYRGKDPTHWHLPKGIVEDDTSLEATALREAAEETGAKVSLQSYLGAGQTDYYFHDLHIIKTIHYFLLRYEGASENGMDSEHDGVEWVDYEAALKNLETSPKREAEFIQRAHLWLSEHA